MVQWTEADIVDFRLPADVTSMIDDVHVHAHTNADWYTVAVLAVAITFLRFFCEACLFRVRRHALHTCAAPGSRTWRAKIAPRAARRPLRSSRALAGAIGRSRRSARDASRFPAPLRHRCPWSAPSH